MLGSWPDGTEAFPLPGDSFDGHEVDIVELGATGAEGSRQKKWTWVLDEVILYRKASFGYIINIPGFLSR